MQCCLSNTVPLEPVVARTTGCLFEKALIERYIEENGRCPVTGEPLSKEDLIPVRPSTPSATAAATAATGAASIPGLLQRLHAEWESTALAQFTLRQQLAQSQQELAHALRQYEAACVVIARLTKERDDLLAGLGHGASSGNGSGAAAAAAGSQNEEDGAVAVPAELAEAIDAQEAARRQQRKEAKKQHKALATAAAAQATRLEKLSAPTATFAAGGEHGAALSVSCAEAASVLYAAGSGVHHVLRYDLTTQSVTHRGVGHDGAVHTVLALPAAAATAQRGAEVLSASSDNTVRLWQAADSGALTCTQTLRYANDVTAIAHDLIGADYLLAAGGATVTLSELARGAHVATSSILSDTAGGSLTVAEVHPYGALAGLGTTTGEFVLLDVRAMGVDTVMMMPGPGAARAVQSAAFHADCLTVATGLASGAVLLWDLRNVAAPVATLPAAASGCDSRVPSTVRFQGVNSAFLGVAGGTLRVYDTAAVLASTDGTAPAPIFSHSAAQAYKDLSWGPDAAYLAACTLGGVVEVFQCASA